jgi:hypothetical protein
MSSTGLTPQRTKVVDSVLNKISETLLEAHVASTRQEADDEEEIAREDFVEWLVEFVENMASKDSAANEQNLSKAKDVSRAGSSRGKKYDADRRSISSLSTATTATGCGSMLGDSLAPNRFG